MVESSKKTSVQMMQEVDNTQPANLAEDVSNFFEESASGKKNTRLTSTSIIGFQNNLGQPRLPVKEGWIEKKSPKLLVGWQKRYVEIKNREIRYYKQKKGVNQLCGVINFDLYSCAIENNKNKSFYLRIIGCKREFQFRYNSKTDQASIDILLSWIEVLNKHISASLGVQKRMPAPELKEFWRFEQLSCKQFLEQADTFDIVMYTCNSSGGKMIRTYSNSEFDHVGMCLKFDTENDEIFLLESTSNLGVHIKRFTNVIPHIGDFYQRVVLRHLDFERSEENLEQLEKFVKQALGKKYGFNLGMLKRRKTVNLGSMSSNQSDRPESMASSKGSDPRSSGASLVSNFVPEDGEMFDKDRTFFCSELVAKCYKVCGVMQNTQDACSNYLPHNFSSDKFTIPIMSDITVESEKTVYVDEESRQKSSLQE